MEIVSYYNGLKPKATDSRVQRNLNNRDYRSGDVFRCLKCLPIDSPTLRDYVNNPLKLKH